MSDHPDVDYLKPFIQSTIDASARFRRVLIVLITVSVLGLGAVWNTTPFGWFDSRLMRTRQAERYLTLQDLARIHKSQPELDDATEWRINTLLRIDDEKHQWVSSPAHLEYDLRQSNYDAARNWIKARVFASPSEATQYAQKLDEIRTSNLLLVRTPFFGSVFDVNSLGLLGGFTFVVILILFRFTLWREYNNLWVTFREAKDEHWEYCYRSLAMQQVLTVPPSLSGRPPSRSGASPPQKPRGAVVQALYFAPFVVQTGILVNDLLTKEIGAALSRSSTTVSITSSSIFLLCISFLTYKYLRLSKLIDGEWDKWKKRVEDRTAALSKLSKDA